MKDFLKNRWIKWAVGLAILLLCGLAVVIAMGCMLFESIANMDVASIDDSSGDGFADELTIPDNIEVVEPLAEPSAAQGDTADAFQQALLAALDTPAGHDPTIKCISDIYKIESEAKMLTLQVRDKYLERQLTELLNYRFDGNSEKMMREFVRLYTSQLNRLKYSGILKWEKDGLAFQREIRNEWQ